MSGSEKPLSIDLPVLVADVSVCISAGRFVRSCEGVTQCQIALSCGSLE